MSWRDDLRRVTITVNGQRRELVGASFRGVPFFVDSSERTGGRRAVIHEFPGRDDPFGEDLGRRARPFRLDGYVLGDDYLTQKDTLISALEDVEGPGELVHPYEGVRIAICTNFSVRQSRIESGIAMFSIEFTETPTQAPVPTEVVDSIEQVDGSADEAITATSAELIEQYDAAGMPAFALASAETAIKNAAAGLKSTLAPVITATQELAALNGQVTILTAEASSLARTPANIVNAFQSTIAALVDTILAAPGAMMNALIGAYAVDLGAAISATTSTRRQEATNQSSLTGALRRVMAIEAARIAPLVSYESIEAATEARDAIAVMLEEQAQAAGDTAYPALVGLRSELLRAVPGSSAFSRVVTVTRGVAIPSLLLAYQLYGDVDAELDLVARNGIRHPGFVLGELKALSDA